MIVGESFEISNSSVQPPNEPPANITWNKLFDGVATFEMDTSRPFHGKASQRITMASGTFAEVTNRGLNNEGLVLKAGNPYTGYVFARAADPTKLTVLLEDYTAVPSEVLASAEVTVEGGDQWRRYNFTLTPSDSTTCKFIPFGSDPNIACFPNPPVGHACQRCGGEVSFGVTTPGAKLNLDFAALHPGEWVRYAGLEVRRDAVEALKEMRVTAVRQGGSFIDPDYYF
jgi:hypothetical protein